MSNKLIYTALLTLATASIQPAFAGVIALDWMTGGSTGSSSQTRGWAFNTSIPISISNLGWYDDGLDGLNSSHQVGIWDNGGTLLISGTVAADNVDPLVGNFRYTDILIGTLTLAPGDYVIGGLAGGDTSFRSIPLANVTTATGITYIEDRTNSTTGVFSFPSNHGGFDVGYFGPNFQFNGATVPEPSSLSLLGIAGLGFSVGTRRSRKQQA